MTESSPRDRVDGMIDVISSAHDLPHLESKALVYRLRRVAHHMEIELKRELAQHGIELWELELLACLRRAPHHRLSAKDLLEQMRLTTGAVTNRVSRLEAKGWVSRELDPTDRRSVLVTLTESGLDRALQVFATKTEAERTLLSAFTPEQQRALNGTLRTLLISLEGRHP
ncbi:MULTISPECIES: MarR family winged helix-turn-helix transcriptional regulator [unclassified Streptomyces]|uniref:MarR family winged helix-turn-helix transcriptional regulator n=1 Tax=unclassified Streptomyces TaxID=2593676 RepID=UPI000882070B|nr:MULTISPECIES: MarR family transcriptional regulator [unclassified Streptomyces]PBC86916.1 MarR family transcriptional regulator [Streptomyces sp. 2321.6]SDQ68016.1 transcriptional regulator, MarR family [Streptomyces sp. KS_16]SEE13502.1 transcriptional regulator, MarR family [Streptomyces sp. 2133.1]SNC74093.1 DNA-binding transcriptional regulator, MarR family [Streptomyces sp. 2114.4]